jgi:hypothetical protein
MQITTVPNVRSGLDPEPSPIDVRSGLDPEPEPAAAGAPTVGSGLWLSPAQIKSLSQAEGQVFLDEAYDSLGLNFGVRPKFDPNLDVPARLTQNGVLIGPSALSSESELKTTLIHQGIRLEQWAEGRLAVSGVHGLASELEARLRQLEPENVKRAELTPEQEAALIDDVRNKIDALFRLQADSSVYDVLVLGKARPPQAFVVPDPPRWFPLTP